MKNNVLIYFSSSSFIMIVVLTPLRVCQNTWISPQQRISRISRIYKLLIISNNKHL